MKIKVLQVVGNLRIGGAETVAMNLYRYIDRNAFEFHYLVYGDEKGAYEAEVEALGGRVIHIQSVPRSTFVYKKVLNSIQNQYGPYRIIHAHMMFHNAIALKAAKECGIPIRISHAHSTNDGGDCKSLWTRIIRKLYVNLSRYAIDRFSTHLIACGEAAGIYLYGRDVYLSQGILLRNGIETNRFKFDLGKRNTMREEFNLQGKKVYACIGHFEKVKNHTFLIDVFSNIARKNENAMLVLLGDGNLLSEIQKKCWTLGIGDRVLFLGNVMNVDEWLQAIDIILMPSLYEGVPLTLIEAQAAGVKCFASDGIAKEANITGDITYLPINDISKWTDIDELPYGDRKDASEKIKNEGYDIKANMSIISKLYLDEVTKFE